VATAATIGTVAVPLIERNRYNARLFLGSIAASGTLGILIPPSINLIVYGLLTHTSVPQLYLAGFIPGALLALLFMATILFACIFWPRLDGVRPDTDWRRRVASLTALGPPLLIFLLVVGSIYLGIATPTEAAALGVVGVAIIAAVNRTLSADVIVSALAGTVRATGMVTLIVLTAMFLNFVLTAVGLTGEITHFVLGLDLGPTGTMLVIIAFYLLLGCVMEEFAMILTTTPIVAPIVISLGYDPVWFGILLVLLSQTAMITPPIGLNLFVVHGIRRSGSMNDFMIGIVPFVLTLLVMIALLMVFPGIATWLPDIWYG
jgi:C4-dicarboxylate transporter DctM subunit